MADFVTGATGCVGHRLVQKLLDAGRDLVLAVRNPASAATDPLFQSPSVRLVACDFTRPGWSASIEDSMRGCENVFHTAGEMPHRPSCRFNPQVLRQVNFESVRTLYDLSRRAGIRRFLYVSSIGVYGDTYAMPLDETAPQRPADDYSRTKVDAEHMLVSGAGSGGPAVSIVRPGLIYGDRDNGVIRKIMGLIDRGYFLILGDGKNVRALSSTTLLADVFLLQARRSHRCEILNVIDPNLPTMNQLVQDIAALLGVRPSRHLPLAVAYLPAAFFSVLAAVGLGTSFKLSDVRKLSSSTPLRIDRLRGVLGEVPDYYRSDLASDVSWYRRWA